MRFAVWLRENRLLALALAATLLLLLAHTYVYRFLTDDAYISFRYARNLAEGHGLVFNPGFERVEGYTNFLWVVLLALCYRIGLPMEVAAHGLSLSATIGLWAAVVALAWRVTPREHAGFVVVPPLLLALTRSVAVWSTGGLETRLFEFLAVAAVLRLLIEDDRLEPGRASAPRPLAALLFALATLTRPDGLLVGLGAAGAVLTLRHRSLSQRRPWLLASVATYAAVVGGHVLFRYFYYDAWLPNTYYAKVGGRLWWSAGFEYLACFVLEYGLWFWLPLLVCAVIWHRRRGSLVVPVAYAGAVLPHLLYVVAIGGDHFEYRPLDLYLPFLFLLAQSGALWLANRSLPASIGALAVATALSTDLPGAAHVQFPHRYAPGFPGLTLAEHDSLWTWAMVPAAERYLDPRLTWFHRLPGLRSIASAHRALVRSTTERFIGVRQEEHRLFLALAVEQGRELAALIEDGRLPRDTYIAVDCVGAIPYYSRLRTLDRLGLTDAEVARAGFVSAEVMAHGKYATEELARRRQVDLWALHNVDLIQDVRHPDFLSYLLQRHDLGGGYYASIGGGHYLGVALPMGREEAARHIPALEFQSARSHALVQGLVDQALPPFLEELERHPGAANAHALAARAMTLVGRDAEAELHYRSALEIDPHHVAATNNLAALLVARGALPEAAALLRSAIDTRQDSAELRVNLGKVLMALGDLARAREQFEAALRLEPNHGEARALLEQAAADGPSAPR